MRRWGCRVWGLLCLLLLGRELVGRLLVHSRGGRQLRGVIAGVDGRRVVLLLLLLLLLVELLVGSWRSLAGRRVGGTLVGSSWMVYGRVVDRCSKFLWRIICRLRAVVYGLVGVGLRGLLLYQWLCQRLSSTWVLRTRIGGVRRGSVWHRLFRAVVRVGLRLWGWRI